MHPKIAPLVPRAIQAVKLFFIAPNETDIVQKEYDGYAASLGATIRTSGLLPALTFYTDVSRSYPHRSDVLEAIFYCLGKTTDPVRREVDGHGKSNRDATAARALLKIVIEEVYGEEVFTNAAAGLGDAKKKEEAEWAEEIVRASVALKLAMRNFKHTDQ